ncbi:hypothetical protein SEPCBS57363_001449 [Sporothrix epigloea]|uniref:Transcription factor n=1 Tax=Sporothrix epigloea TaxID=1892477 RepID=A0ABP0DDD6_9PEZI
MVQQRGRGSGSSYPPSNNTPRQNEYFVPRDGIDREVITADICRYLGNDALVRPGTHTNDSGRVIQGYFITAYRNLTTAMIADLKADSARWEAERRNSQAGAGTPAYSQRDQVDDRVHNPNSQAVKYQDSQIRDLPQRHDGSNVGSVNVPPGGAVGAGPYGSMQPQFSSNGPGGYDSASRYPGSDSPGYNATGSGGPGPAPYGPPGGHGAFNNAPYAQGGLPPPSHYSAQSPPVQDPRYAPMPIGGMGGAYGGPINNNGVHPQQHAQEAYASGAHYAVVSNRDMYNNMDMQMTDAPVAPIRRSTPPGSSGGYGNPGNSSRGPYGAAPPPHVGSYGVYSGPPPPAGHAAAYATPIDGGYGRAPNANPVFSPADDMSTPPPHAQQYEDPTLPRTFHPSSPARTAPFVTNTQAQLPNINSGQQSVSRNSREPRAVNERPDQQMRDRERERDDTPPSRNGPPPKSNNAPPLPGYGRR